MTPVIRHACDHVRSHARILNASDPATPTITRGELSPTTVLRSHALQWNRTCSLAAYGVAQRPAQGIAHQRPSRGIGPP